MERVPLALNEGLVGRGSIVQAVIVSLPPALQAAAGGAARTA
jgi:hypothetical protein